MNLDIIPNEKEIISIIGHDLFSYYNILTKSINLILHPDIEIWDNAGRRGKYLHGYRMNSLNVLVDIYLNSINSSGKLSCTFKLPKKSLNKILKQKEFFSSTTQDNIDSAQKAMEKIWWFLFKSFYR